MCHNARRQVRVRDGLPSSQRHAVVLARGRPRPGRDVHWHAVVLRDRRGRRVQRPTAFATGRAESAHDATAAIALTAAAFA